MATWIVPTKNDVANYIAQQAIDAANDPTTSGSLSRLEGASGILAGVVAKFRGAIHAGGASSVSATAGSVPPEAVEHVLVMCVAALGAGMGSPLANFIHSDLFKSMLEDAREWLKLAREGMRVQGPDDPQAGGASLATVVASGGERLTRDSVEGF